MGHHHDHDDDQDEMDEREHDHEHGHPGGFVTGVLLGGLIGIGVGLLMAPASGQDTRHRLRSKAMAARDDALQVAEDARAKAEELENSGRELIEENKRRIVRTAEAVKQSAQEAWTSTSNTDQPHGVPASTSMNKGFGTAASGGATRGPGMSNP